MAGNLPGEVNFQFGVIPIGQEATFRSVATPEVIPAALDIRDRQDPDIPHGTSFGTFVWRHEEGYDVVSALTTESGPLKRATSIIFPAGQAAGDGVLIETHLFSSADTSVIESERIKPAESKHLRPFQAYGRALWQAILD